MHTYIYMYIYIHTYISIHVYTYIYIYKLFLHEYVRTHTHTHTHIYMNHTMTDVYTAALLPTKPSSDDVSGFRHGFEAKQFYFKQFSLA